MSIRVAIVEDDLEIGQWLKQVIEDEQGMECTGVWNDGSNFLKELDTITPDVVLMDIHLPSLSGVECVKKAKASLPGTQFIMCTIFEDVDSIFQSLCAGATGYLLKTTPAGKIREAIHDVINGGSPMSAIIARKVVGSFQPHPSSTAALNQLSAREREILDYLSRGFRYKEIADKLYISTETVRTHIRNIYEKLQVQSRTEALNKVFPR